MKRIIYGLLFFLVFTTNAFAQDNSQFFPYKDGGSLINNTQTITEFAFSNTNHGLMLTRFPQVKSILSDHEMMIRLAKPFNVITYNILERCYYDKNGKYWNNGYLISHETDEQYHERLLRIAKRIRQAVIDYTIDIVNLQEAPCSTTLLGKKFDRLLKELLPDFLVYSQGNNRQLVKTKVWSFRYRSDIGHDVIPLKRIQYRNLIYRNSELPRIMALYFHAAKTVVVNVHAPWAHKESEDNQDLIDDFNAVLTWLANHPTYSGKKIQIFGDFNRENSLLLDENLTIDIDKFAKKLSLENVDVERSRYTKIKYDKNTKTPGILTSADYVVTGTILDIQQSSKL